VPGGARKLPRGSVPAWQFLQFPVRVFPETRQIQVENARITFIALMARAVRDDDV